MSHPVEQHISRHVGNMLKLGIVIATNKYTSAPKTFAMLVIAC